MTQYSCHHPNLAPQGCVQYYFGEATGVAKSFNYDVKIVFCIVLEKKNFAKVSQDVTLFLHLRAFYSQAAASTWPTRISKYVSGTSLKKYTA